MKPLSNAIERTTRAFLEAINAQPGPQIHELSVEDARGVLSKAQAGPIEKQLVDVEDRTIPAGPRGQISVRIVRPKGSTQTQSLPTVMYFHGGGWVLGNKETHDRLVREIASGANVAVIFVNFAPAPEAKYPVQIEEAYAATKYVAEHGRALNLDVSRLAVAGDSAGGNMAAVVAMLAKERGGPNILFQLLFYPVTDAMNLDTPSYQQFGTGHFLTREAMKWFWGHYLPDAAAGQKSTASPLLAAADQLKGLPPALIITGEFDVLRDEGEAYAHKLTEAGVHVTAIRYLGTLHDFVMLNALANTPAARAAIAQANGHLRRVFSIPIQERKALAAR